MWYPTICYHPRSEKEKSCSAHIAKISERRWKEGDVSSLGDEKDAELAQDLVHDEHCLRSSVCKMLLTFTSSLVYPQQQLGCIM